MFDDKKTLGSYDDLKNWYKDSSQFCMFHTAAVRPDECAVHIKEVMDDKGKVVKPAKDFDDIMVRVTPGGDLQKIKIIESTASMKTLGEMTNPTLQWGEELQEVHKLAQLLEVCFKKYLKKQAAELYWNTSFVPAVLYKVLFAEITEAQLYTALQPAWTAFKRKIHGTLS